jgi:crossover junction endodeoxyribonuclease RuvC
LSLTPDTLKILGIDPGTDATGFGAIESDGESHRLIEYGVLRNKPSRPFTEKLLHIHTGLVEVIERARPDRVVVESLFYAANVKSALQLGHARGVALLAGVGRGLPVEEYSPLEVKQAVVGYGRADKQQVQKMVALLLGLDTVPEPHDAADALAVALCHAHRLRFEEKLASGQAKARQAARLKK